jgi:GntR family transcriptional repressor for pyruvate dehydrogenase complex
VRVLQPRCRITAHAALGVDFEPPIGTMRFLLDNFNRCPIVGQSISRGTVGSKQGRAVTIAEFAPVRRETVMEMVARRIEALVRSGDLRSGSRLPPEPKLAGMLHVSRGSLREALKGLVFLGLVRARPGDGTYIQPSLSGVISRHFKWMLLLQEIKYLELLELRQILEPAAAALAARRATKDDIEKMKEALSGMRAGLANPERFMVHEIAFHECILQAAKNAAIHTTMRMMYDAMEEGRRRVLPLIDDLKRNCDRHERIFDLIQKRDSRGARLEILKDLHYAESLLRRDLDAQDKLHRDVLGDEPEISKRKSRNNVTRLKNPRS